MEPMVLMQDMAVRSSSSGKKYTLISKLPGGGYNGQVWLAASGSDRVALKLIQGALTPEFQREINVTRSAAEACGGRGVPRFYEGSTALLGDEDEGSPALLGDEDEGTQSQVAFIAMEYIDGVCASNFALFPEEAAAVIMSDLCGILRRLHQAGIIYADVKGDNVLVSRTGRPYLCDFSSSIIKNVTNRYSCRGTAMYMAPEVCYDPDGIRNFAVSVQEFDEKADIWSLGITAMELVLGPGLVRSLLDVDNLGVIDPVGELLRNTATRPAPRIPKDCQVSRDFQAFVAMCLVRLPSNRSSADQLLASRFLAVSEYELEAYSEWLNSKLDCVA